MADEKKKVNYDFSHFKIAGKVTTRGKLLLPVGAVIVMETMWNFGRMILIFYYKSKA